MPISDPSRYRRGAVLAAACALALTACAAAPGAGPAATTPAPSSTTAESPTSPTPSVEDPGTVAAEAIELFARPDEPERRWFAELRPYLDEDYAVEAEYIDPARIPFSEVRSGPKVHRDADNPQLVTVDFQTDDGTWTATLHQDTTAGEWLVGGIAPAR